MPRSDGKAQVIHDVYCPSLYRPKTNPAQKATYVTLSDLVIDQEPLYVLWNQSGMSVYVGYAASN